MDAFHIVQQRELLQRFFVDERSTSNGIRITDAFREIANTYQCQNLPPEIETRWRLVETAWRLNVPRYALVVHYAHEKEVLEVRGSQRASITGCRVKIERSFDRRIQRRVQLIESLHHHDTHFIGD